MDEATHHLMLYSDGNIIDETAAETPNHILQVRASYVNTIGAHIVLFKLTTKWQTFAPRVAHSKAMASLLTNF
eukprot:6320438-Pyramimonas_sp.AAC.1